MKQKTAPEGPLTTGPLPSQLGEKAEKVAPGPLPAQASQTSAPDKPEPTQLAFVGVQPPSLPAQTGQESKAPESTQAQEGGDTFFGVPQLGSQASQASALNEPRQPTTQPSAPASVQAPQLGGQASEAKEPNKPAQPTAQPAPAPASLQASQTKKPLQPTVKEQPAAQPTTSAEDQASQVKEPNEPPQPDASQAAQPTVGEASQAKQPTQVTARPTTAQDGAAPRVQPTPQPTAQPTVQTTAQPMAQPAAQPCTAHGTAHMAHAAQATLHQVPQPASLPAHSTQANRPPPPTATALEASAANGQQPCASRQAALPPNILVEAPSAGAIDRRLRRVMLPTPSGTYKVSERIRNMWDDRNSRGKVIKLFEACGYDTDRGESCFGKAGFRHKIGIVYKIDGLRTEIKVEKTYPINSYSPSGQVHQEVFDHYREGTRGGSANSLRVRFEG